MRLGIDSAYAGTVQDFNAAYDAGIEWVGEYFGGAGCYHVWSNADRATLGASKIPYRLPIWVPHQSFATNPIDEANQAITAHRILGFRQVMALDVERNSGYMIEWGEAFGHQLAVVGLTLVVYHAVDKQPPSMGASWLAFWTGNPPGQLEPRSARQYRGNTNSYGMSVDFSICTDDFPLEGLTIPKGPNGNVDILNLPKGRLNAPITCAIDTPDHSGGWLIGADGGVFTWGKAQFFGSMAGKKLAGPIMAALVAPDGHGYTLIGSDGGTFRFGSGPDVASLA